MREINDLAQKAASQHGLLTHLDLRDLGVTTRQLTTLVSKGVLRRVRRGVFVLAGTPQSWEHQLATATIAAGGRGAASHRSAMRQWDLRPWERAIEVCVRGVAAPRVDGAVVHRSYDLIEEDVRLVNGIRTTSVERTLADAGTYLSDWSVQRAFDAAIGTGLTTVDALRAFRERVGRHGRSGVTAIDRVLENAPAQIELTESPMEVALLRLIDGSPLPAPVLQHRVVAGGESFRIDIAYPGAMVLVEYDGYLEHIDPDQFAHDRWRQNLLVLDGWLILRFSRKDLFDRPEWVVARITDALERRPPRPDLR